MAMFDKSVKYDWKFENIGGASRVKLTSGEDIRHLAELDPKMWTVLSCPVSGLEIDEQSLKYIDCDADGKIRVQDVIKTSQWITGAVKNPDLILEGKSSISVEEFNTENPDGKRLASSAREILKNLGKEGGEISLSDTEDIAAIFAKTRFNGDSIITEATAENPQDKAAISAAIEGIRPFLMETQALVSTAAYGTPQRSATGFDQRRLNMLLAVLEKRVGFKLIQKDVFINIAGGLRVTDMAMDLSVIAAVLSSNVDTPIEAGWCMAGEVGLSGEVRPVNRIEQRIAEAEKLGFTHIIIPKYNLQGLNHSRFNIEIHPVKKVEEALRALFG